MKIISLRAENLKRLTAVCITPDGNLVQITGKNGAGKSSVLDSIWWAIAGADHIQSAPIRAGEDWAEVELDLGELIVVRSFARKEGNDYTTKLTVSSAKGAVYSSPQKMLDKLLSTLCFDPVSFNRMKPREQFDALKRFVPDIDFDEVAALDKGDRLRRTKVNGLAEDAKAAAAMIFVPPGTPDALVDETALVQELADAGKFNAILEQRKGKREAVAKDILQLHAESAARALDAVEARRRADELDALALQLAAKAVSEQERLDKAEKLEPEKNTDEIQARIKKARETNAAVTRSLERIKQRALAEQYSKEADTITAAIEAREKAKRAAIAKAEMPVEGLGFGDGHVTYSGMPLEQASSAEQLRVSTAIAMAGEPPLRIVIIREGSLLDSNGVQLVAEMADKRGFQVWMESVDSTGSVGFYIEDGHLKQAAEQLVQQGAAA